MAENPEETSASTIDAPTLAAARSLRYVFYRQGWHLAAAFALSAVAWFLANPALGDGRFLGISDRAWFWVTIAVSILHQLLGWLVFRGQLGWGILTRWFGERDLHIWGLIFMPLLAGRPLTILALALADSGSLTMPLFMRILLGVLFILPAGYAVWSVLRYFGIERALGGDHFRLHFRKMAFVGEGAFRWSSNAMYAYVFLGLWSIALLADSRAALAAAFFQHAFVWAHYYCTEEPDMTLMYGTSA